MLKGSFPTLEEMAGLLHFQPLDTLTVLLADHLRPRLLPRERRSVVIPLRVLAEFDEHLNGEFGEVQALAHLHVLLNPR